MNTLPTPPMSFSIWGTEQEAKPLSANLQSLVSKVVGSTTPRPAPAQPDVKITDSALTTAQIEQLAEIVGSGFVTQVREQRIPRARGKSYFDLLDWREDAVIDVPDAVIAPATNEEVLAILQWCTEHRVAVVPFGGGTSVVGGVSPLRGEFDAVLSLDLARFDAIENVDTISGEATLGSGMSGPQAEIALAEHGLQLGHFPQSFPYATIGGFAATRSSGQNSAGYGRFDEMVASMEVVTPTGITTVGDAAPASAAGPDIKEIFLGSEGAFGVITKVRLKVHPIPEAKEYEAFVFDDFAHGVAGVRAVEQQGTGPTVIRLSDEIESATNLTSTDSIGESDSAAPHGCLCLTMYEGTREHVASRHEETRNLLLSMGATSLGEGPVRKWEKGRFGAPVLRDALLDAGVLCETFETATTWSNVSVLKKAITAAVTASLGDGDSVALVLCHVSHVYHNGCSLYFTILGAQNEKPLEQWGTAKRAILRAITDNGGTITHHHAVGKDHAGFMDKEVGEVGLGVLRAIKKHLDPAGILNPGKLLP
ncbi:putative FAD-linked oxidoreductase [Corynebacterium ciconiae DSM 44920]|nr:putative FAD-linked oxidoreductase [Corynebacterium ciconiae DSM 44920]